MNIRTIYLILLTSVFFSIPAHTAQNNIAVFIGTPIEVKRSSLSCGDILSLKQSSEYIDVCLKSVVEIVYEVNEEIFGVENNEYITVYALQHSLGFPEYITAPETFIILKKIKKRFVIFNVGLIKDINQNEWVCISQLTLSRLSEPELSIPLVQTQDNGCPTRIPLSTLKAKILDLLDTGRLLKD